MSQHLQDLVSVAARCSANAGWQRQDHHRRGRSRHRRRQRGEARDGPRHHHGQLITTVSESLEHQGSATRAIASDVRAATDLSESMTERMDTVVDRANHSDNMARKVYVDSEQIHGLVTHLQSALCRVVRNAAPEADRRSATRQLQVLQSLQDFLCSRFEVYLDLAKVTEAARLSWSRLLKHAVEDHRGFAGQVQDAMAHPESLDYGSLTDQHSCQFGPWYDTVLDSKAGPACLREDRRTAPCTTTAAQRASARP